MIVPCGHRLLVKPLELQDTDPVLKRAREAGIQGLDKEEDRQKGGIDKGVILAIGVNAFKEYGGDPWAKVGDQIAYAKYAGKKLVDPETQEEVLVINDEDLVAIIKEKVDV